MLNPRMTVSPLYITLFQLSSVVGDVADPFLAVWDSCIKDTFRADVDEDTRKTHKAESLMSSASPSEGQDTHLLQSYNCLK